MSNPLQPTGQPAPDAWQAPGGAAQPAVTDPPPAAAPTAYGYGPATGTTVAYAGWGSRVGSMLIDLLPPTAIAVVLVLGGVSLIQNGNGAGGWLVFLGYAGNIAFWVWNSAIRQGKTGQSIGKSVLGTRLVAERTGLPVGAGMAFARALAHILDSIPFYLGYLWPLWDAKKQTFADKVCSTVVVKS